MKQLIITGIRGVPAAHGGFETFAENLALYLVGKDWKVTIYCQESTMKHSQVFESVWEGVKRIHIPVDGVGAKATVLFDYLSVKHAASHPGLVLTLGYNTAVFNIWFRIKGKQNLINMDGIEWKRQKWSWYEKAWLYLNERAGCMVGNHLIADHPEIKKHLMTRVAESKITMIPYGARSVVQADETLLARYGVISKKYVIVIARPEPENSILEIVKGFSLKPRGVPLLVLGRYEVDNPYHAEIISSASEEVKFIGAVYEHPVLDALRFHSSLYVHGHTVGGTNPSLIEALGSGQAVLAHDNLFNRWVLGEAANYFGSLKECAENFDALLGDVSKLEQMSVTSRKRFEDYFTWETILTQYETLLTRWL